MANPSKQDSQLSDRSGKAMIGSQQSKVASLTDSSGGTADDTIAAVSGSGADAAINNNFADLAAKVNALLVIVEAHGLMADA